MKNCVIERDNSTLASDEISFDREYAKCGFSEDVIEIPEEIEFDLRHQMTLHICPDIFGLLGDKNGNSGTIRSNCTDATIATSKTAPSTPINYFVPRPKPPILQPSTVKKKTPTVTMPDPPDTEDSPTTSPIPATTTPEEDAATTPSLEEASSNRSREPCDD